MPPKTGSSEPKVDDEAAASKEERKKLEMPACLLRKMVNDGDVQIGGVDLSKMDDCVAVCEYLAEHGRDNPDVNLLLFHDNSLTSEGAEAIARIVVPCYPNITRFWCFNNKQVGDAGVEALAIALGAHCPKLEFIYLVDTGMTDTGFAALCRYAPASYLSRLHIAENRVTRIPGELRRFDHLAYFYCQRNPWSEAWKPNPSSEESAASALAYARSLPDPFEEDVMIKPAAKRARVED